MLATVALLATVTTFALITWPTPSAGQQRMPQFAFNPAAAPAKLLLGWDDTWEAGQPDSAALLTAGRKLTLRLALAGDFQGGLKRILVYRCPGGTGDQQLDLDSLGSPSAPADRCPADIAFNVGPNVAGGSDSFDLTLSASKLDFRRALTQYVAIYALAQHSGGSLRSSNLYLWSLDPLNDFPAVPPVPSSYDRSFLTAEAITFLTGRAFTSTSAAAANLSSVQFIEPTMIDTIKSSPPFLRAKLNLGALLNFDPSGCGFFQYGRSTMFTSYDSTFDSRHLLLQKVYRLDMSTGLLWYSGCRLASLLYNFYQERRPADIGICLVTSYSGALQPHSRVTLVRARMTTPADFGYADCAAPGQKVCSLLPGATANVTVFQGTDYTPLRCPIVCDDPSEVYRFFRGEQLLIPPASSDWDLGSAPLGLRLAQTGNVIELPPTANASLSGVYRCEAGDKSFVFNVRVVAMPRFAGDPLPQRVFAMEGEGMTYGCTAAFSGLPVASVSLAASFHVPGPAGAFASSWSEASGPPVDVTSSEGSGATWRSLSVSIRRVPPGNFTHRFVCRAAVAPADAASIVGLPGGGGFTAQAGTDVVFVRRPTRSSFLLGDGNSCAIQRCHLGVGASFNFSLSPAYAAHLADSGVDVVAYLRLDDLLLTDVAVLMRPNVSAVTAGNSTQRSLVYRVWPLGEVASEARRELEKRSSLTPVFNFRYRGPLASLGNLHLTSKTARGPPAAALGPLDCRSDPLCFYSTDFDTAGDLAFLTVRLTFKPPAALTAEASMSYLIGIIVACAIVILALTALLLYLVNRAPAKTYRLEEQEIRQGHDPTAEARDEKFKEYQRAEGPGQQCQRAAVTGFANVGFAAGSVGHLTLASRQSMAEDEL